MSKRKLFADEEVSKVAKIEDEVENPEANHETSGFPPNSSAPRVSARMLNRQRKEEDRKESESCDDDVDQKQTNKPRRTWEQWSYEDKTTFFQAINEYGKNFEAIWSHFQTKAKKKGLPGHLHKSRDQIRAFYYRTWHKISRYIEFPEQLKKSSRELYGLINFGELRKKTGSVIDERNGMKLNELVFKGTTTLRIKGKTVRVRTPTCRALRRINSRLDGAASNSNKAKKTKSSKPTSIPTVVTLILKPATTSDLLRVHSQSMHNPHVCVRVPVQRQLSSVITHLHSKWQTILDRTRASLQKDATDTSELWVIPKQKLRKPSMQAIEPLTSTSLSLSQMKEKLAKKEEVKNKDKKDEVKNEDTKKDDVKNEDTKKDEVKNEEKDEDTELKRDEETEDEDNIEVGKESAESAPDDDGKKEDVKQSEQPVVSPDSGLESAVSPSEDEDPPKQREHSLDGWNLHSQITIGELYLMHDPPPGKTTLELSYTFRSDKATPPGDKATPLPDKATSPVDKASVDKPPLDKATPSVATPPAEPISRSPVLAAMARILQKKKGVAGSPKAACSSPASKSTAAPTLSPKPAPKTDPPKPSDPSESSTPAEFRRPVPPPNRTSLQQSQAFRQQLDLLMPKYSSRRGRPLARNKVVSRQLTQNRTLQPRVMSADGNVKLRLLPLNKTQPFTMTHPVVNIQPSIVKIVNNDVNNVNNVPQIHVPENGTTFKVLSPLKSPPPIRPLSSSTLEIPTLSIPEGRALSPTNSINSLLDSVAAEFPPTTTPRSDHFLDSVLENSSSSVLQTPPRIQPTPPSSPSREVNESLLSDLSLSNLLGANDSSSSSSSKQPTLHFINEDSSHSTSSEVDRQFLSMITENSVDFTSKFARLASHVTSGDPH